MLLPRIDPRAFCVQGRHIFHCSSPKAAILNLVPPPTECPIGHSILVTFPQLCNCLLERLSLHPTNTCCVFGQERAAIFWGFTRLMQVHLKADRPPFWQFFSARSKPFCLCKLSTSLTLDILAVLPAEIAGLTLCMAEIVCHLLLSFNGFISLIESVVFLLPVVNCLANFCVNWECRI